MPRTADEQVWDWLLACLTCGKAHHLHDQTCECGRPTPHAAPTWAGEDGHGYRPRWRWEADGDLLALRVAWDTTESPDTDETGDGRG